MSSLIIIGIIVAVILIVAIILIVLLSKKKNNAKETPASILDIQNIGVSTNNQEFSYGYEKEETIVMQPVDVNTTTSSDTEKKESENIQNTKVLNVSTDDAAKDSDAFSIDEKANEYKENKDINDEPKEEFNNSNTSNIEIESIGEEKIIK